MKLTVLYGTETGNSEMLAEDLADFLSDDHEVTPMNLCDFDVAAMPADMFYLVICSTYGDGELPASAKIFAQKLVEAKADLGAFYFGMFGLGDREYDTTFNFGSSALIRLLCDHGAHHIGEVVRHDASGPDLPEDLVQPWALSVLAKAPHHLKEAA